MVKDAELNKEDDQRKKEVIEIRNQADSLVYQTQKSLDEMKDKIDTAEAEKIQKTELEQDRDGIYNDRNFSNCVSGKIQSLIKGGQSPRKRGKVGGEKRKEFTRNYANSFRRNKKSDN